MLALSAGGADGAYGAGVLTGWSKNGSRPKFDVVTGVSTGALMAVLAFLGPEYDGMLESFYTTQTNDKIYTKGAGLLGESLYDNGPLKEQISAFVTQAVLDRIAEEHAKDLTGRLSLDGAEVTVQGFGGHGPTSHHHGKLFHGRVGVDALDAAPTDVVDSRQQNAVGCHVRHG